MMSVYPIDALQFFRLARFAMCIIFVSVCAAWGQTYEGGELPSSTEILESYRASVSGKKEIPQLLRFAFIAAEDPDYFETLPHKSAFTEQIVKSEFLLSAESSIVRMARFYLISMKIQELLSHDEILNWYMNRIFLGSGCYGVSGAALAYFGHNASDLSIGEAATMAALAKQPFLLSRPGYHDRAIKERNRIIEEMRRLHFIDPREALEEMELTLATPSPLSRCQ